MMVKPMKTLELHYPMIQFLIKQLLDEIFVISRIIKVGVRVISRSRSLQLITIRETLIMLDITKTESNNVLLLIIIQISYTVRIPIFWLVDLNQVTLGYDGTTSLMSLSWCNSRGVNSIHHCHYRYISLSSNHVSQVIEWRKKTLMPYPTTTCGPRCCFPIAKT